MIRQKNRVQKLPILPSKTGGMELTTDGSFRFLHSLARPPNGLSTFAQNYIQSAGARRPHFARSLVLATISLRHQRRSGSRCASRHPSTLATPALTPLLPQWSIITYRVRAYRYLSGFGCLPRISRTCGEYRASPTMRMFLLRSVVTACTWRHLNSRASERAVLDRRH